MSKNCPYCSGEMELGYIQCRDGLFWTKKVRPVAALPPLGAFFIHLGSREHGALSGKGSVAEAYRCDKCKIVLMEYDDTAP